MEITIKTLTSARELYRHYSGQTSPQPCYIQLDCDTGIMRASYNAEIGNAVPADVWHGHCRRWSIPCLVASETNLLMEQIKPQCERICAGYESLWNGSNHVAHFNDDAIAAEQEICDIIAENCDSMQCVEAWDADDWFDGCSADDLKIRAEMTDDEIFARAAELEQEAESHQVLIGVERHLRRMRDTLAE